MDFPNLPAGDHRLFVRVGRERRPFRVHVPGRRNRPQPIVAFDGVTLFNPEGNMGTVNGLDGAADRYGFVAIHPIPKTRYFGILAGWNTRGGFLFHRRDYDDVDYVGEILCALLLDKVYAVGFSAGAQFAHILAGRLPGMIAGVVSVSGAWLGTEPAPAPGTAAWIIHGEDDHVLPYGGGAGSWRTRVLAGLGNRNVLLSRPHLQVRAYADANGYGRAPLVEERNPVYVKRNFGPACGVPVVEYIIRRPHGGHTYHGRKTGESAESLLSRGHGRPLAAEVFSINDHIVASLGSEP